MQTVKLPELGEGVTEGELVKWLVKIGDKVTPDQSIAEIMTDKATVEVPSPIAGVVKELKFKEGDTLKVESVLMLLEGAESGASTANTESLKKEEVKNNQMETSKKEMPETLTQSRSFKAETLIPPVADSRVLATPATRRLARELDVDINSLQGTGLAGRVTQEDVLAQTSSASQGAALARNTFPLSSSVTGEMLEERVALKGIRKKIAENMQAAKRTVPHFTLMDEFIVTSLVQFREEMNQIASEKGSKMTYLPLVMKALIATIKEFPMFNASIDDEKQEIVYKKYFNLGFAADTPNGLVVPVIKFADQKSLFNLSQEILDLSKKARDGKLKPEEMKGATITVTNIGSIGGTYATPIINHPEVAILGMYKITDKIVVTPSSEFKVEKAMNFTITADHRLIDGAVAARFLKSFGSRLNQPGRLMLDLK